MKNARHFLWGHSLMVEHGPYKADAGDRFLVPLPYRSVAQLVEHATDNRKVIRSILIIPTIKSERSVVWYRACFGSRKSLVQIQSL